MLRILRTSRRYLAVIADAMEKRSPRRLKIECEETDAPVQRGPVVAVSQDKPPPDSVSWRMWEKCLDIANLALDTKYMQGIAHGKLDPNNYGSYTVQDCGYCYHAQSVYEKISERAKSQGFPELAVFSKARYDSYARYNATLRRDWHISPEPGALELGEAAKRYVEFEEIVANECSPIYGVVMMIPCDQLWPYMASKLQDHATDENLYRFWITENNDWHGAYRLDNFINGWVKKNPGQFDEKLAYNIYRTAMICELNFFRSACGQELYPIAPLLGKKR